MGYPSESETDHRRNFQKSAPGLEEQVKEIHSQGHIWDSKKNKIGRSGQKK
jgi:hypothetical protein